MKAGGLCLRIQTLFLHPEMQQPARLGPFQPCCRGHGHCQHLTPALIRMQALNQALMRMQALTQAHGQDLLRNLTQVRGRPVIH